jgi:hypothetical protein
MTAPDTKNDARSDLDDSTVAQLSAHDPLCSSSGFWPGDADRTEFAI